MAKIKAVKAREILDSRGLPTVEVDLTTEDGVFKALVPSGTSTGKKEALELRDGGVRYLGMGVLKAVLNVNKIIGPKILGMDPCKQKEIDEFLIKLDGHPNKSKLGANAILGVSLAVLRAGACSQGLPLWKWIAKLARTKPSLPTPCFLYAEGGLHGKNDLEIQEFMVFFQKAGSFKNQLRVGTETYHALGEIIRKKYGKNYTSTGMEGAFSPPCQDHEEVLELIERATKKTGFGKKSKIIIDAAASYFFKKGRYYFESEIISHEELLNYYLNLCQRHPIFGIEDPFAETDWQSFQALTRKVKSKISIIGDDLLATNFYLTMDAEEKQICNGLILKPNQAGTVTETIKTARYALKRNWQVFVKHRSGETYDTFIADLATGLGTGWIMAGAPTRGERVAKYNRLLIIEEEMKKR
jgi:enolase